MSKHPWLLFLSGMFLGAAVVGFFWFGKTVADGMKSWSTPHVYFDEEARERIARDELKPSPEAKDIYFYIDGFQDHTIFIAYTDKPEAIDKTVFRMTGKRLVELEPLEAQLSDTVADREPGQIDKKYLTSLYDVDVIRKGRFYDFQSDRDGTVGPVYGWHIIVDEETSRLYWFSWDT